jgi:hypothetical protein
VAGLRPCVAPLHERVDRYGGDEGERDEACSDDGQQAAPLEASALAHGAELVLGLPRENRRPEHVVEDLVPRRRAGAVDAADDPVARQRLEQAPQLRVVDVRVLGKVGRLVRDLASGG